MTRHVAPATVLVYVGGDLVGDGLIKLPFVRALRHAFPDARVTWLAGVNTSVYAGVLAPLVVGLIDEVIEDAGFERWADKILHRPLGGRRFDLVIDTQRGVPRSFLLRRLRHGRFVSAAADFWLSDARPPRPYRRPPSLIGQLLELVALASGSEAALGPPPPVGDAARAAAERLLPDGPIYVGIAPGAGSRHKCWPLERFVALAEGQAAHGRVPVIALGPDEADWRETFAGAVPGCVIPACDDAELPPALRDSPLLTIALAARFAAAVANDSGTGHMFAAADAPLVSLFGPSQADKFAPAASRAVVVRAQEHGGEEMAAIPPAAVEAALETLLAPAGAAR